MPEGNEIHRWAERHAAAFAGRAVWVDGLQGARRMVERRAYNAERDMLTL
jgi:hypothetical protein